MNWRILGSIVLLAVGCGTEAGVDSIDRPEPTPQNEPRAESMEPTETPSPMGAEPIEGWTAPEATSVGVLNDDEASASVRYPDDAEDIVMPRPRRRMNIDQLRLAMEQVSGGISWTEGSGRNEVNLFESLASTLGKPDFAQATDEELEPTILFQKFLGDAARSICFKMLDADLTAQALAESEVPVDLTPKLLMHVPADESADSDPAAVVANVQWLVQRFHGRRLAEDASGLSEWKWLHQTGTFVSGSSHQAWVAVCVGLFTHPDFYMY